MNGRENHHLSPDDGRGRVCHRELIDRLYMEATGMEAAPRISWPMRLFDAGAVDRFLQEAWGVDRRWKIHHGVDDRTTIVATPDERIGQPERYSVPHVELALTVAPNGIWIPAGVSVRTGGRRGQLLGSPQTLLRASGWRTRPDAVAAAVDVVLRWIELAGGDTDHCRALALAHVDEGDSSGRQRTLF